MRLLHTESGERFLWDPPHLYQARGGRIRRDDLLEPGPLHDQLCLAASHFETHQPGQIYGSVMSCGNVNAVERAELDRPQGTAAIRPLIQEHLAFFDPSGSGFITVADNYRGWRRLGFGILQASLQALGASLVFGWPRAGTIEIGRIQRVRPSGASGIYDAQGQVDQTKLDELLAQLPGEASHEQFWQALDSQFSLGRVPRRQFKSLLRVCQRMNGRPTITPDQVRWLYDGSLLWKAARGRFAPRVHS